MLAYKPYHKSYVINCTLVIALIMHMIVLLGIKLTPISSAVISSSIDVILAKNPTDQTPKEVNFFAQVNQQGGGSRSSLSKDSTQQPESSVDRAKGGFKSSDDEYVMKRLQAIHTTEESKEKIESGLIIKGTLTKLENKDDLKQIKEKIALLQDKLHKNNLAYASIPTIHRVDSAATQQDDAALYMESWKEKITQLGKKYYPEEAELRNLSAELEVAVQIKKDGSLNSIEILRSSGYEVIDNAALEIIRKASPFKKFPQAILNKNIDVIEIIRTWRFESQTYSG